MTCQRCGGEITEGRYAGVAPSDRARFSKDCRDRNATSGGTRRGGHPKKYVWTEPLDAYLRQHYHGGLLARGRVVSYLARQTGWPRWVIKKRAQALGLTLPNYSRQNWTLEEEERLEKMIGRISAHAIAKRLGRSEASVALKIKRLGVSRRISEGYTMRALEACLGEDHHKIQRWIANGWLRETFQGTARHDGNGRDIHRFREKDILDFIRKHPNEICLGKVDQLWFLDLVLLKGAEADTRAPEREIDEGVEDAA